MTAATPNPAPAPSQQPPEASPAPRAELLILVHWEELAGWLLDHTGRWPRSARFTLAQRVQNHVLDVLELLVQARYEPKGRRRHLQRVNLLLERLRHLLRMAKERGVMPNRGFETAMRGISKRVWSTEGRRRGI